MNDAILIVEDEPKKVSSSVGHSLMNDHSYAQARFDQANKRTVELVKILETGDMDAFIQLAESEALTLHAMMMTSSNYYLLFKPGTIAVIEKIFQFRAETGSKICFTLDAGPNVHILYPDSEKEQVEQFIQNSLMPFAKSVIHDRIGEGPTCMSAHVSCN
jgi:diphosphomevalonate decarboxylase